MLLHPPHAHMRAVQYTNTPLMAARPIKSGALVFAVRTLSQHRAKKAQLALAAAASAQDRVVAHARATAVVGTALAEAEATVDACVICCIPCIAACGCTLTLETTPCCGAQLCTPCIVKLTQECDGTVQFQCPYSRARVPVDDATAAFQRGWKTRCTKGCAATRLG